MGCRTHLEYIVEPDGQDWSVRFCGQHYGRYRTQREALDQALWDANRVARLGQDIAISVRNRNGAVRSVWSYSADLQCMTRSRPGRAGAPGGIGGSPRSSASAA